MAYKTDPATGTPTNEWETEDDTVASRLPGLLAQNSPLMEKAKGDATRTANRRGLQNSTIAAGEGTKAALGVVVPIATQDAQQTAQKNLAAQGFGYNTKLQGQQIQGQKEVQAQSDTSAMDRLRQQGVQEADIQRMRDAAQKERDGIQLTSEEKRAADQINAQKEVAGQDRASRENIALRDNEQQRANSLSGAVAQANSTYTNGYNSIMSNNDMPAAARNAALTNLAARRDAEIDLANQIFNATLSWPTAPAPAPAGPVIPDTSALGLR